MRVLELVLASVIAAAPALAAQEFEHARKLMSSGDTSAAAAIYEQILQQDRANAEAHYQLGMIHFRRYVPGTNVSRDRRIAERHIRYAQRLEPDSAQYSVALARLLRTFGVISTEIQVNKYLNRAKKAARRQGGRVAAEMEYEAARWDWKKYEHLGRRFLFIGDAFAIDQEAFISEWRYVEDFFGRQVKPDPGDPGAASLAETENHLRASVAYDPSYIEAAGLLLVVLAEKGRWEEAREVTRTLTRSVPDSGRAWALEGLVLARMRRWARGQASFRVALERMTPGQRSPYDNLSTLLKRIDSLQYEQMNLEERAQLRNLYWAVQQPLYLTELNEVKTEFFARLTYVNARWSDPQRGYQGYESDRGAVFLRYGPPDVWATLGRGRVSQGRAAESMQAPLGLGGQENKKVFEDPLGGLESENNTVVWIYTPSRLRYVFSVTPGFNRAVFAGDLGEFYRQSQAVYPARFDNVPIVRGMDSVVVQYAQFRGDSVWTDIGAYSFVPVGRMVGDVANVEWPLETGAIVKDNRMSTVVRQVSKDRVVGGDSSQMQLRTWRFRLRPAEYLMRVEALIKPLEAAARSSAAVDVRDYTGDTLLLSDVLIAARIEPRDSNFARWTDFLVVPSAGTFGLDEPVSLLWEIYNLEPDDAGDVHYRVDLSVTVDEIERRTVGAQIIGGLGDAFGLSAKGDADVTLGYDRTEKGKPGGTQIEYLTVELSGPRGYYEIELAITDLMTGRVQSRLRTIRVTGQEPGVR